MTLACHLLETFFSENYPHLPDVDSEQNPAYSTFPSDPYLWPGTSNNISLLNQKQWPMMISVCLRDIFKTLCIQEHTTM